MSLDPLLVGGGKEERKKHRVEGTSVYNFAGERKGKRRVSSSLSSLRGKCSGAGNNLYQRTGDASSTVRTQKKKRGEKNQHLFKSPRGYPFRGEKKGKGERESGESNQRRLLILLAGLLGTKEEFPYVSYNTALKKEELSARKGKKKGGRR